MSRTLIIYAKPVKEHLGRLKKWGIEGEFHEISGDESDKTFARYEELMDRLIEKGFQKQDTLVAMGGGAVLDLVGFVAATFKRGIRLVFIPTTLLAMVDASIGGKNGINHRLGKNQIGTLYFPHKTYLEIDFLKSLPLEEHYSGFVEMVKIFAIDKVSLEKLSFPPTVTMIEMARKLKEEIVEKDPKEKGERFVLNFGHTVGHALEFLSGFTLSHGEAVEHGMRVEMRLLELKNFEKIEALLPFKKPFPKVDREQFIEALIQDKKNRGDEIGIADIERGKGVRFFPKEAFRDDRLYT